MRRVLNSGTIKLPSIQGYEYDVLRTAQGAFIDSQNEEEASRRVVIERRNLLDKIKFYFEIKAPLLVFNTMSQANLGTLHLLQGQGGIDFYLPPQTYKLDPSGFIPMDSKSCNELNTKLNNFYNWSFNFHNKLIESGLCREQAELILPQGLFTSFLWQINARDLVTFIEKYNGVSPELYGYCSTLMLYLEDHLPITIKWARKNKWLDLI